MTCYDCGNIPHPPNYLQTFTDDLGDEYHLCLMCDDFQREYNEASPERKQWMAYEGYGEWQKQWYEEEGKE
jgi:hypothetical protein